MNQTWELTYTVFINPFGNIQYIRMFFGLANFGSVYSRMLKVAMKEIDRVFWTSYLDDVLHKVGNHGHILGM